MRTISAPAELRRLVTGCLLASFRGSTAPPWLLRWIEAGLGGVTLFDVNIGDDVGALTSTLRSARDDVVVALDEEGGDVTRLEVATGSSWPGNAALGAVDDVALTREVATAMGAQLTAVGVDLDLAPCADVNSNPANPVIGVRSFGADPALVARHAAAFVAGLHGAGVAACVKHFPGHGDTTVDSHVDLPVVDVDVDVLRQRELVPFVAAINAGVDAVMTSHLVVPAVDRAPATVSRRFLVDVLRGSLGFEGPVVTDALDMRGISAGRGIPAAAVASLVAGADVLCLGARQDEAVLDAVTAAIVAAVTEGALTEDRLVDAATRRTALQRRPAAVPVDTTVGRRAAARALQVDGVLAAPVHGAHVVECQPPPDMAQGRVPWGVGQPLRAVDPTTTVSSVTGLGVVEPARPGQPLVVVVRNASRHRWQLDVLRTLAVARPDLIAVEMGWPGPDPLAGAVAIRTFGASRVSGEAVAHLLVGTRDA
ncbi:MAG TPA: glycoside hydrolase family 3 N-terminal domain-containing protein [Acidimicrobiales bacterium]